MTAIVLDVNVVVAAILAPLGTPRQILSAWQDGYFTVVSSEGILAQIEEKLRHPKIGGAYGVTEDDIDWVRALLMTQSQVVVVAPHEISQVTGDPEDDYVLATTRLGEAAYLVTGDRKLQALGEHHRTKIISPREFLETMAQRLAQ